ncbi:chemotaxis protein CheW [Roseibium sp. Sym1]|jgi:purine-binding chemotaxis protein CheW|uniref:chemotaxis protein CheW n=1 Tax=Roseibium sp. Sym1 TaxID=3016006 RepID=UPI0022B3BAD7|nr:chemotaxis protein CheW [Roseibium sp. Sym1]
MSEQIDNPLQDEVSREASPVESRNIQQFISFKVGDEEFAIDIMAVREIKGWTATAPLPNQPEYNLGVLNLRGTIVPTFDLRCRFGMGRTKTTPYHVVIIASVQERTIGLLVDAVSDILTVNEDQIRPVPDMERITAAEFLSGIITVEESMVVLLSLEKLFHRGETSSSAELAA